MNSNPKEVCHGKFEEICCFFSFFKEDYVDLRTDLPISKSYDPVITIGFAEGISQLSSAWFGLGTQLALQKSEVSTI